MGIEYVTLEELCKTSDIITVHIPLFPSTYREFTFSDIAWFWSVYDMYACMHARDHHQNFGVCALFLEKRTSDLVRHASQRVS
jgi:hypothetical protein